MFERASKTFQWITSRKVSVGTCLIGLALLLSSCHFQLLGVPTDGTLLHSYQKQGNYLSGVAETYLHGNSPCWQAEFNPTIEFWICYWYSETVSMRDITSTHLTFQTLWQEGMRYWWVGQEAGFPPPHPEFGWRDVRYLDYWMRDPNGGGDTQFMNNHCEPFEEPPFARSFSLDNEDMQHIPFEYIPGGVSGQQPHTIMRIDLGPGTECDFFSVIPEDIYTFFEGPGS